MTNLIVNCMDVVVNLESISAIDGLYSRTISINDGSYVPSRPRATLYEFSVHLKGGQTLTIEHLRDRDAIMAEREVLINKWTDYHAKKPLP